MTLLDFPHRCSIVVHNTTRGEPFGVIRTPVVQRTNVVCWDQPLNAKESKDWEKVGQSVMRKIYFLSEPYVTERHVIRITSRDNGVTTISNPPDMRVRAVSYPDSSAGMGVVWKVIVEILTGIDI